MPQACHKSRLLPRLYDTVVLDIDVAKVCLHRRK
jgi:hypothetical protein